MGEFNSNDHYIYYCGQEFLRRNGIALTVNKSPKCSTWVQSQKQQNDLSSFTRQTVQHHCNPSLCPKHYAKEAEVEQFYEDLQNLLEPTPKKDTLFIKANWNAKVGSQEIRGEMGKFGLGVQNEAEQSLTEFCQESALDIANTLFQQQKRLHMDPRFSILT